MSSKQTVTWVNDTPAPEDTRVLVTMNSGQVKIGVHVSAGKGIIGKFLTPKPQWWVEGKMMMTYEGDAWRPRAWAYLPQGSRD